MPCPFPEPWPVCSPFPVPCPQSNESCSGKPINCRPHKPTNRDFVPRLLKKECLDAPQHKSAGVFFVAPVGLHAATLV